MTGWLRSLARRYADGLSSQATEPQVSPPSASIPRGEVSPASPAVLLAKSLTDRETRAEWVIERGAHIPGGFLSSATNYVNKVRDITITDAHYASGYSYHEILSTPFSLTDDEKKVVRKALKDHQKHLSDERERAALARLVGPAKPAKKSAVK